MEKLEQRILKEGELRPGGILKVDGFLNHRIDPQLSYDMAVELKRLYEGTEINKILTIEASGIAIATVLAEMYDVPVVFAQKSETANSTDDKYVAQAYSFTHKQMNQVFVSKPYLRADDKVLIVDDFLADGQAMHALIDLVHQAGGAVVGIAVAVEKGQQDGGKILRSEGYHLESMAIVESMDWETQTIRFREQPKKVCENCNLKLKNE